MIDAVDELIRLRQVIDERIQRAIDGRYQRVVTGRLVGTDTVQLTDTTIGANRMYCRLAPDTRESIVVNGAVTRTNVYVWIIRLPDGQWYLDREDVSKGEASLGGLLGEAMIPPALKVPQPGEKFRPGLVRASESGGLNLYLEPHAYYANGIYTRFGGGNYDLTPDVPASASTWCWVLVGVDETTNTIDTVTGTAISTELQLLTADAFTISIASTFHPRCAVKLRNGQTTFPQREDDIIDIRAHFDSPHPKNNYSASAAPGVGDDSADGYSVGSQWLNTTADDAYICLDAAAGAAVWKKTTP